MPKNLVIVESPAKAKTLSKMLGKNYEIRATVGHVRDLPKSHLGVDIENGFSPKYVALRNKGNIIGELKTAASSAKEVYLATDPDREGEAISWHILQVIGSEKKCRRVAFHEITEEAIKKAFAEPRKLDMNLVNAQQARRILDRLVGYKLSPLLWRKVTRGLSAGRVQSVAVRIIVDREQEIEDFKPTEYWKIEAWVLPPSLSPKQAFKASFQGYLNRGKIEINNAEEASLISKELQSSVYAIKKITRKEITKRPSPPFTTSTLQQEAWRKLHFSAKQTMTIAQQLYEGLSVDESGEVGLITYMRTDSVAVSKGAIAEAREVIVNIFGPQYLPEKPQYYGTKTRGAQEAHEAIRPTLLQRQPALIKKNLKPDQYKLYKLIWDRMVASQMESARYDNTTLEIVASAPSKKKYLLNSAQSLLKFKGFLALYITEDSEEDVDKNLFPQLDEGHPLNLKEVTKEQNFTKPPSRYSEGTLIRTLENEGIGRPSTYAPIISTIVDREYVIKENGLLKPTDLGKVVTNLLVEYFPTLFDLAFTARMEDGLDKVAAGEEDYVTLLSNFYPDFAQQVEKTVEQASRVNLPPQQTEELCPHCGQNLIIKSGRFGKFLACPNYPDCKYTKALHKKSGVSCPKCGGDIIEKKSLKGKNFFGCSGYPNCDFVLFYPPVNVKCTKCESIMTKYRGKLIRCSACGNIQKSQ